MKKLLKICLGACLASEAHAFDTPFAGKLEIFNHGNSSASVETDFNIGWQIFHEGKPSEYGELVDDYRSSINAKQWIKFNIELSHFIISSYVFEFTLFEL